MLDTCNNIGSEDASTVSPRQIIEVLRRLQECIVNSMPGSVYIYDLINQHTLCSSCSLAAMLGYTASKIDAMESMGFAALIHPDDLEQVAEYYQRFTTLLPREVIAIEYRMLCANGTWRWLRSQETLLVQTVNGVPLQLLGIVQDITESKREGVLLNTFSDLVEQIPNLVLIIDRQAATN